MGTKVIPREVGKIITYLELREIRYNLKLSETQRNLIIGTLLGDGCLIPNSWGKLYRLQIEHCIDQKAYLWWKYTLLRDLVITEPRFQERNKSWKFRTGSHPEFTEFAKQFYTIERQKQIPHNISMYLKNPFVFSVWYMDDGGLRREKGKVYGAFLNTQSFSQKENQELQGVLKDNYNIDTLILLNHGKPRLYIPSRSLSILKKLLLPYIHDSMRYKLP